MDLDEDGPLLDTNVTCSVGPGVSKRGQGVRLRYSTPRIPTRNGGWSQGGKIYLIGVLTPGGPPFVVGGAYDDYRQLQEAMRRTPLRLRDNPRVQDPQ
jgi:hypothetical protein